jgi:hypothetical protein
MKDRFKFTTIKVRGNRNVIGKISDSRPNISYINDVCTVFEINSPVLTEQLCDALNMAHELSQLPPKATKADMQSIINKYRISIS